MRKMHQRRGAGGGVRACGARRAQGRGRRREAERAEAGDSIADGTTLRYIVGEEVAATFRSSIS